MNTKEKEQALAISALYGELAEHMKNCGNCKFHCEDKFRCIASGYKEWKVKPYE